MFIQFIIKCFFLLNGSSGHSETAQRPLRDRSETAQRPLRDRSETGQRPLRILGRESTPITMYTPMRANTLMQYITPNSSGSSRKGGWTPKMVNRTTISSSPVAARHSTEPFWLHHTSCINSHMTNTSTARASLFIAVYVMTQLRTNATSPTRKWSPFERPSCCVWLVMVS